MLPPRRIHFADRGAFWECRTNIASEYLPDGFPNMLVSPLVRRTGNFEWAWNHVVQLHSAANLTFGKDKLPALSGAAKLGHNETGDQSEPDIKRPVWRALSWSWASVDGSVTWFTLKEGILDTKYAHVLNTSMTPYGDDPFGQVTTGVVRIACSSMVSGHLVPWKNSSKEGFNILLHSEKEEKDFPFQIDFLDDANQEDTRPVYLLPILGGKTGSASSLEGQDKLYEWLIEGIVLRPTNVTKGEFSRIGSFNLYKTTSSGREVEKLQMILTSPF